jgi:hypothetical protein
MTFTWKILEISADNDLITHAKYSVVITDGNNSVETEGNWWFANPTIKVPFSEVTEEMVVSWIEQETMKDGINLIKSRLEEQLNEFNKQSTVVAPWLPQVFTPNN